MVELVEKLIERVGFTVKGVVVWLSAACKDWISTFLPIALLFVNFAIASFGPWLTFLTLIFMPITLNITKRRFNIKDASAFYFNFTLYSMLVCFFIFEVVTNRHFAALTRLEYMTTLSLGGSAVFCIIMTRARCIAVTKTALPGHSRGDSNENVKKSGEDHIYKNYDFCKKCRKTIAGRDHHCVWLNTCVGRSNKKVFVATVFFSATWLFYTIMINLTSMCFPVFMFNGWGFNDGTSTSARWFLVPMQCPDVYEKGQLLITLCFVVSIYGLGVSLLLLLVLIHQIRLLCLGMSYLEYKYGTKKITATSNPPQTADSDTTKHFHSD